MNTMSRASGAVLTLLLIGPALFAQEAAPAPPPVPPPAQREAATAPASKPASPMFEAVVVGKRPFYHGSGLFALGGALGGLIASSVYKDEPDRIAAYVLQEKIDLGKLVSSEFERQLLARPAAKEKFSGLQGGRFTMTILYGITSVPFSEYRPYLSIHMTAKDAAGAQKWKDREYVGGHGDAKAIPYPDFFKGAEVFTHEFEDAAKEVVTLLLNDFVK